MRGLRCKLGGGRSRDNWSTTQGSPVRKGTHYRNTRQQRRSSLPEMEYEAELHMLGKVTGEAEFKGAQITDPLKSSKL